jgi:SSS family solute:Na+ symporter
MRSVMLGAVFRRLAMNTIHWTALLVFTGFFLLVTLIGFMAARWHGGWRPGKKGVAISLASLDEWGLGGRRFGTLVTWFLIGGEAYTAYTIVAVPALVYGVGGYGFFAVPYAVFGYPLMLVALPRFWRLCHSRGYVTLADFVRGSFESRWLGVAFALTGILATMPYIALQLIGMQMAIAALGVNGEWPLIVAFLVLAAFTYTSGMRAPALIAVLKDLMLWVMVLAAIIVIPAKLGGYAHIFQAAGTALAQHHPPAALVLGPGQYWAYATLALGSMLALFLYPHNITAILSSGSAQAIQRNAALLQGYNVLLGLVALMGYMALAAGIQTRTPNMVVPLLFMKMFPEWFAGFCMAAIGVGALVPAAIMSIGAANLVTRNLWGEFQRRPMTAASEATMAKVVSLVVKAGALAFVIGLPLAYAIQLQLLGGVWMVQLMPGLLSGLVARDGKRVSSAALLTGWVVGMVSGTAMVASLHLKSSIYPVHLFGGTYPMYAAIPSVVLNALCVLAVEGLVRTLGRTGGRQSVITAS